MPGCTHPKDCREPAGRSPGGSPRVKCLECGRVFVPRGVPFEHGTYEGYCRHQRTRDGEWCWPAADECGCNAAATTWRAEYRKRPEAAATQRRRQRARAAALARLARMYPAEYRAALSAEDQEHGVSPRHMELPRWESLLDQLLKSLGTDPADLARSISGGWASGRDRETWRLVRQLRVILSEVSHRPELYYPRRNQDG